MRPLKAISISLLAIGGWYFLWSSLVVVQMDFTWATMIEAFRSPRILVIFGLLTAALAFMLFLTFQDTEGVVRGEEESA